MAWYNEVNQEAPEDDADELDAAFTVFEEAFEVRRHGGHRSIVETLGRACRSGSVAATDPRSWARRSGKPLPFGAKVGWADHPNDGILADSSPAG